VDQIPQKQWDREVELLEERGRAAEQREQLHRVEVGGRPEHHHLPVRL
jgi:hypothetical protein